MRAFDVQFETHVVALFKKIRNIFTRCFVKTLLYQGRGRNEDDQESRKVDNVRLWVTAGYKSSSKSYLIQEGGTSVWKFDNISRQILHGRDKSCKTPGTSLKIPNFIAAVKSDTLRGFGIAPDGIRLATHKKSRAVADLSSGGLPSLKLCLKIVSWSTHVSYAWSF